LLVLSLQRHRVQQFAKGLAQITKFSELEKSNCFLQLAIGVEEVLKHEAVSTLFGKLQSNGTITKEITEGDWVELLVENYKQTYNTDSTTHEVKFNIKNNLLWKNGEIDFGDAIYHELFIPYDDPGGSRTVVLPPGKDIERRTETFLPQGIHEGITVRAFLVNGIVKLQIGRFSKRLSPEVVGEGLAVYKTYETITSFPLLYFSWQHRIPENFLNLSAYATESSQAQRLGEKKSDSSRDWKQVVKDVADYNYVCSVADEYVENRGRFDKIIKRFEDKRNPWLETEGFVDPFARNSDDQWQYHDPFDNGIYYANKYLTVAARNYHDFEEHRKQHLYTDYYEEMP
jgi:hypothetical protein